MVLLSNVLSISSHFSFKGLVSLVNALEAEGLLKHKAIESFVQIQHDDFTEKRLTALSKMTDWIADLDARMARIQMEKHSQMDFSDDEETIDGNEYNRNIFNKPKHKTAADYDNITSFMD